MAQVAFAALFEAIEVTVARYGHLCQDWEFWSEADCPWVAANWWGDTSRTYPILLRRAHQAIKGVQPEARVWSSGNGMDMQFGLLHACLDKAPTAFEVANIHPYFMRIRDRTFAQERLEEEYNKLRLALQPGQVLAASEWGYPTHNVDSLPAETYLRSNVVPAGVRQLYWSEAPEWYRGDLETMARHGFEVVIVHGLRDAPVVAQWGESCGLLDSLGRPKSAYKTVQEWAWRGRAK